MMVSQQAVRAVLETASEPLSTSEIAAAMVPPVSPHDVSPAIARLRKWGDVEPAFFLGKSTYWRLVR